MKNDLDNTDEQDRAPEQASLALANENAAPAKTVATAQPRDRAASTFSLKHPKHRSTGLRLFDVFLYPFLTNFVVFGLSVAATYLTSKGGQINPKTGKPLFGEVGKFFEARGKWMDEQCQNRFGMNKGSAEMTRMVFFSFVDGTFVAPLVKIFEDRREKIGKWIDDRLGTTPPDPMVYKAEPKQTWGSVVAGRLLTVMVVVPTAVLLNKLHWKNKAGEAAPLNDVLFHNPGRKTGEWIAHKPNLAKRFGQLDIPKLSSIAYFEMFYTSVCTTGLYFISRLIAKVPGATELPESPAAANTSMPATANENLLPAPSSKPVAHINKVALEGRIHEEDKAVSIA